MRQGYASVVFVSVLAAALALAALGAHTVSVALTRSFGQDWRVAQARLAADTGIERALRMLLADPQWRDGDRCTGPVCHGAEVERVEVLQQGSLLRVVSVGKAGGVRRTAWAVVRPGLVPLLGSFGGGIKVLGGQVLEVSGSANLESDVLAVGGLLLWGSPSVGTAEKPRTVYAVGDVAGKKQTVFGDVYATGTVSPGVATGREVSGWVPAGPLPSPEDVGQLLELARLQAEYLGQVYPAGRVFTAGDLTLLRGVVFVEGDVVITGGNTGARAALCASGGIRVYGNLDAPRLLLLAGEDVDLSNSTRVRVAAVVARGSVGWGGTGGGRGSLVCEYGALVASELNGNFVRGNVRLRQDDSISLQGLAGPVHSLEVVERGGD